MEKRELESLEKENAILPKGLHGKDSGNFRWLSGGNCLTEMSRNMFLLCARESSLKSTLPFGQKRFRNNF